MSEDRSLERPSQVTAAGLCAVVAAGLVLVSCYQTVADLHTVDVREGIREYLTTPFGKGLGLSVSGAQTIVRVTAMVAASAAVAALVLAVFALKRDRKARVGMTIAGALLLLASPVAGGVLAVAVAAAAALLWTQPARDWFAGRPPRQRPGARQGERTMSQHPGDDGPTRGQGSSSSDEAPAVPPAAPPAVPAPGEGPPPTYGFGQPEAAPGDQGGQPQGPRTQYPQAQYPPANQAQGGYPQQGYPAAYGYREPDKRPTNILVAAILTWVVAGLTGLLMLVAFVVAVTDRGAVVEQVNSDQRFKDLSISTDELVSAVVGACAVIVVMCLIACLVAFFLLRRQSWARVVLTILAALSVLLGVLALPVGALHLVACVATLVLMFTGGSNEWFKRPGAYAGPPGPTGPGNQGGQPPVW